MNKLVLLAFVLLGLVSASNLRALAEEQKKEATVTVTVNGTAVVADPKTDAISATVFNNVTGKQLDFNVTIDNTKNLQTVTLITFKRKVNKVDIETSSVITVDGANTKVADVCKNGADTITVTADQLKKYLQNVKAVVSKDSKKIVVTFSRLYDVEDQVKDKVCSKLPVFAQKVVLDKALTLAYTEASKTLSTQHKLSYDLSVFTEPAKLWIKEGKNVTVEPKSELVDIQAESANNSINLNLTVSVNSTIQSVELVLPTKEENITVTQKITMQVLSDGPVNTTVQEVCQFKNRTAIKDTGVYQTTLQNSVFDGKHTIAIQRKVAQKGDKVGKCGSVTVEDKKTTIKDGLVVITKKGLDKPVSTKHNVTFDFSQATKSATIIRMGMIFVFAFIALYFC